MRLTNNRIAVLQSVALPALLAFTGCFTDLTHPPPNDANVEAVDSSVSGPDRPISDDTLPSDHVGVSGDAFRDARVTATGGAGGFDGGGEARGIDGPQGGGGIPGSGGSGGGGFVGTGGVVASGGIVASGGTTAAAGGAGGGTVVDAPVDQKVPGPAGTPCSQGSDCAQGICIDGVCCATTCSGCNACSNARTGKADGTCAPVLTGQDPHDACADETTTKECGNDGTCDGAGACRKVSTSHVCEAGACSDATFTPASTCDGQGACTTPTPENCAPYQCAATGCLKTCSSQAECGATNYCKITSGTTGTCAAKSPNGTPATQTFECSSGIVADGVCCDKACTGCNACSGAPLTGAPAGTCSFVLDGQIAHNACTASGVTCGLDGKCDGAGACRSTPKQGQSCDDPANKCVTGRVCQSGVCTPGTTTVCPPSTIQCRGAGTCDPSTGSCNYPWAGDGASCTDNNACTNDVCQGGSCASTQILCNNPPACKQSTTCSGGTCSYTQNAPDGTLDTKCPSGTQRCYSGQCKQCASDGDCQYPSVSCRTSDHTCVCRLPSSGNVLKNPGFNGSLTDWTASYVEYSPIDADGCPGSGSVYIESSEGDPAQCFPVTAGRAYRLGLRLRGGVPASSGGFVQIGFYDGNNCAGSRRSDTYTDLRLSDTSDPTVWLWYDGYSFTPPDGVVSAKLAIFAIAQWVDQIYVTLDGSF